MQLKRTKQERLTVVAIVAVLLSGSILLSSRPAAASRWVRTRDGWERAETLRRPKPIYEPGLHPLTVAWLLSLGSLMGLIAFPGRREGVRLEAVGTKAA